MDTNVREDSINLAC